jgi:site-specific recombinase XerD
MAKDFWFFSYACNGINFKDMLNLQYKNIEKDTLTFVRAKTANTNKSKEPVRVHLNDYLLSVIEKYGNKDKSPRSLIFPILNEIKNPTEKKRKLQNFTRLVNQHILNYAKSVGIDDKVSSYWARHSFATNAINSGASMEFVSEALSHSNLNTTKAYFAGFEDEKKKEISNKLMEF